MGVTASGDFSHSPDNEQNRLAVDRTVLASERTFLAWLRTGLAIFAGGLGVMKFARDILPPWIPLIVASVLVLTAAAIFLIAAWRYTHMRLRLAHLDIDALPAWQAWALGLFLTLCALVSLAAMAAVALF